MKKPQDISVTAAWDPEAQVWFIASSDLPDLHLEGATLQELYDQLPGAIEDLLEGQPGEASRLIVEWDTL